MHLCYTLQQSVPLEPPLNVKYASTECLRRAVYPRLIVLYLGWRLMKGKVWKGRVLLRSNVDYSSSWIISKWHLV
jgi:hypothetical protein